MAEIIKVYEQVLPAVKLVGKHYTDRDKKGDSYAEKWEEWFQKNWFAPLERIHAGEPAFEESDAYVGLCRVQGTDYQYWIGMLVSADAPVPEGYEEVSVPSGKIGVCWVYGTEPDVYFTNPLPALTDAGYEWIKDEQGVQWCFERYACPRFTAPDEKGNIILDQCFWVK